MSIAAAPEPMDCGMEYVSVGPGSWVKCTPQESETSSNQPGGSDFTLSTGCDDAEHPVNKSRLRKTFSRRNTGG